MLKRLILWYKINRFYKTFAPILDWTPSRVRMRDLSNDDCIMSVGFDIYEVMEYHADYAKSCLWLYKYMLGRDCEVRL